MNGNQEPEPTALLLIAHGSRREEANTDLRELAARIENSCVYPIAVASFLELAEPDIQEGGRVCVSRGARRVLLIPYFLSDGVHLKRDLTAARDDLARHFPDHAFHLGPPLGPHDLLDQLVLARAKEAEQALILPGSDARPGALDEVGPRQ